MSLISLDRQYYRYSQDQQYLGSSLACIESCLYLETLNKLYDILQSKTTYIVYRGLLTLNYQLISCLLYLSILNKLIRADPMIVPRLLIHCTVIYTCIFIVFYPNSSNLWPSILCVLNQREDFVSYQLESLKRNRQKRDLIYSL